MFDRKIFVSMMENTLTTITADFKFCPPADSGVDVEKMVKDTKFLEKLKAHIIDNSVQNVNELSAEEMRDIYDQFWKDWSPEKVMRLFGYVFYGYHANPNHKIRSRWSDSFVCTFYKFYLTDPDCEFVLGTGKFAYTPEVIKENVIFSQDNMAQEVDIIGSLLQQTLNTLGAHSNIGSQKKEIIWMANVITTEGDFRAADRIGYLVAVMGRKTFFDRPDKMGLFWTMVQVLWNSHCDIIVSKARSSREAAGSTVIH